MARYRFPKVLRDWSAVATLTGVIAALMSYCGPVLVVFQAAQAFGASRAQVGSWMWALGMGMGAGSIGLSLLWRKPVVFAWSTPGAAVLATSAATGAFEIEEAVGAFLVAAALTAIAGASGSFGRLVEQIPRPIAAALLAAVLARFLLDAAGAATQAPGLALLLTASYLGARAFVPRYALFFLLAVSVLYALVSRSGVWESMRWALTSPVFVAPRFTLAALTGLALPLFILTTVSQNLPGAMAIRASGYQLPTSQLLTLSAFSTLVLAPFGAFSIALSSVAAMLCMGAEAHPDPARRYISAMTCGIVYIAMGICGAPMVDLLIELPGYMVVLVAGLALLGTFTAALSRALQEPVSAEAAVLTFVVTLSGVSFVHVASPVWGLMLGLAACAIKRRRSKNCTDDKTTADAGARGSEILRKEEG